MTTPIMPTKDTTTLRMSIACRSGLRLSGSSSGPRMSRSSMTGMFIRNAACQLNVSMTQPPTMGPTAAPTEAIAAQMAICVWDASVGCRRFP
jgi:hypothetical protein